MKPSFLLTFLLLSFIISQVQGIRLKKEFLSFGRHEIQEGTSVNKGSNGAISGKDVQCEKGQCSSGNNRNLIAKETSINPTTPTTIPKNEANGGRSSTDILGGKQENVSIASSPDTNTDTDTEHQEAKDEQYRDHILDIAVMDYSPARKKPPIHN